MASVRPRPAPAVVFIGFMGAGKTSAARACAGALGLRAEDADQALEAELGGPIPEWFDEHGEAAFREVEERVAGEMLERADGGVLSLGGGALASDRVRAALERHVAVLLDVDADTAWRRASGRARPLARDRRRFDELHAERRAVYEAAADAILPVGDRNLALRALPALEALREAPPGVRMIWATSASGEYPAFVGPGALGAALWPGPGRRFAVTDEHVGPLHGSALDGVTHVATIPAGETHKTLTTAESVLRALAEAGMTRGDHVLALGGGVVGDLAGLCAATYQRGVAVVQAPTTLVAQVDSAYGGKTGVDLPEGKNYVGAYHQPHAVIADTDTLRTLPAEELAAGYAEVLKTALIAGGALWDRVAAGARGDEPDVILACARTKLAVVAEDERDGGRRQVLNLGHTVGHAIESATGYARYRHGEAVGLGLLAALRLSGREALRGQVEALLAARGLPTRLQSADPEDVARLTARDKKRTGEAPTPFVLVERPGDVRAGRPVSGPDLLAAVRELAG